MRRVFASFSIALAFAASQAPLPGRADSLIGDDGHFFPLVEGLRWTYADDRFDRTIDAEIISVQDNGMAVYRFGSSTFVIDVDGDSVDIELPDEGFAPYYRFLEDTWLHRDVMDCEDSRDMTVTARGVVFDTLAGVIPDGITIEYGPGICADAGRYVEGWAPNVGLVHWGEVTFAGAVNWELVSIEIVEGPAFRRGDVDTDGIVAITDPIATLGFLFLGSEAPDCLDAADSDDDGTLTITDAVVVLSYLFLGSDRPAPPGPDVCGRDPTEDSLAECDPASCGAA
jgi:hypothetical protein